MKFLFLILFFYQSLWAEDIWFMTYNVENLFDLKQDPNKDDFTFIPMKLKKTKQHNDFCKKIKVKKWRKQCLNINWDQNTLDDKLSKLTKVVTSVNNGKGPDVLFLQEVENIEVLKYWNENFLSNLKYLSTVLIEGNDKRGIDVAILSKFPVNKSQLHPVKFNNLKDKWRKEDTRGILEAEFKVGNDKITAYSVHFPAPFHPLIMREQSMEKLKELMNSNPNPLQFAAGDFNVIANEDSRVFRSIANSFAYVSHHIGCAKCLGTNYYGKENSWSFLDAILVHHKIDNTSWKIDKASIDVHYAIKEQANAKKQAIAYNPKNKKGVSDHLPVVLKITK